MSKKVSVKTYLAYGALGVVIMWGLEYLAFAFIIADLNAFNWTVDVRVLLVFMMFVVLIVAAPILMAMKEELEN